MSKERLKSPRARMFVALDLPEMAKRDIAEWGEARLANPALRPVPPQNLHVTLAFLGWRDLEDVDRIVEVIEWSAEVPIMLELGAPVGRPERGRAKLIALPALGNPVQKRGEELAESLAYAGLYEPEKRPFWPHVTVARVRPEKRGSRRPMQVEIPSGPSPTARIGWFDAVRISLYRSVLQPEGAQYEPLAQVELPGRGWW